MKQNVARIALGLAITALFIGHAAERYPSADGKLDLVSRLDNILYDARVRMSMPRTADARIVILDIDEKSLAEIGRWPWSRRLMAEVVDKLFERHGVAVLGFDVVWAEPDTSSGMEVLDGLARELKKDPEFQKRYARLRPTLDFDARFAASFRDRPVVLGHYFNSEERAVRANALPAPVLPKGAFEGRRVDFPRYSGYTGNLPLYVKSAAGAGHINPFPDIDGVLRRVPLLIEFEGEYYEALSVAMVRALLARQAGTPFPIKPGFPPDDPNFEWLDIGPLRIPVDQQAAALIPYRGSRGSFRYVSLADVLRDRVAPGELQGKIALVGTTTATLFDMRATPVGSVYPGVEIHANLIAGMLDEEIKEKPRYVLGAEVATLLLAGIVLSLLIPRLSALWASAVAAGALAVAALVNVWVWGAGLVLPLASLALTIAAIYIMNMAYGYFVESRARRQLAGRFREYVPPEIVEKMELDPEQYDRPKSAELTILFSDIRGFTGISESLSPEALRDYINEYLTVMSSVIRDRHGGTLDKYIGDAIMAFWGAPMEDPQHARHAVLAALEMQQTIEPMNETFAARGWPPLRIGIGVNSGTVRVGNMGSRLRRAYTAMGDAVNVASRLEGRTKIYSVGILVGEATRSKVKDVVFREIDRVKVKGRDEAITIYEPLGLEDKSPDLQRWDDALRAYRAREWDAAESLLRELQRAEPGRGLYEAYLKKVQDLRREPPSAGWDGITVFDEK